MSAKAELDHVAVRQLFSAVGALFRYPGDAGAPSLVEAIGEACEVDHDAAVSLGLFGMETFTLSRTELQSVYTATFDLAPSCSPYLGDWLFDEECRDRASLMIGLRARMHEAGFRSGVAELPDHVAVVLSSSGVWSDEEWAELGPFVIRPALAKMNACLEPTHNPYRHLVAAAHGLASVVFTEGGES